MSIAFDIANSSSNTTGASLTFSSASTGSLINGVGIVSCFGNNGGTPTSVTWNGAAMTLVNSKAVTNWTTVFNYIILAPPSGVSSIVVTFATNQTGINASSASYSGVNQSTTVDNTGSSDSGGSFVGNLGGSLTPVADNCWMIWGYTNDRGTTVSAGSNTTVRTQASQSGTLVVIALADNNGAIHPAASTTLNYTNNISGRCGGPFFSLAPATGGGGSTVHAGMMLGMGM